MMLAVVVGAGVVGLACAAELATAGHDVVVVERERLIGSGVSSRNSEVIHSGMHYPRDSLQRKRCIEGRKRLYDFARTHHVPFRKCGKLIVCPNDAELPRLEQILAQGLANGVEGLELIDGRAAQALEPNLSCSGALMASESGIIDSHQLMLALHGVVESHGGSVALACPADRVERLRGKWRVRLAGDDDFSIDADILVNAAGLGAQAVAHRVDAYPQQRVPAQYLSKGTYFKFAGRAAFQRLIYPMPVHGGLGVHVTLDMAGGMRFGPDVEWIDAEDYLVDESRASGFYEAIRQYFPSLPDGSLVPDFCGVRPRIYRQGQAAADFVIDLPAAHGLPGLAMLFGIESPGLTSCLSIAAAVRRGLEA